MTAALRPWGFWGDKENQKQFLTEIAQNLGVREVTSSHCVRHLAHTQTFSAFGMVWRIAA